MEVLIRSVSCHFISAVTEKDPNGMKTLYPARPT